MSAKSIIAGISLGTKVVPQDYSVVQHYPGMAVLYPILASVNPGRLPRYSGKFKQLLRVLVAYQKFARVFEVRR